MMTGPILQFLVPAKYFVFLNRSLQKKIVSENSPWRDYFKNKKFCRDQKQFFFFFLQGPKLKRDIFAGRVPYFSLNYN